MEPFLGQIALFAFDFAPKGWAPCDGRLLSIESNTALFSLLGTLYGGDGVTTFGVPDLRGRAPIHLGDAPGLTPRAIGQVGGTEAVTLTTEQIPAHSHAVQGTATSTSKSPAGQVPGFNEATAAYGAADGTTMAPGMAQPAGGSMAHDNMQPYMVLNYCIAIEGIYPPQT